MVIILLASRLLAVDVNEQCIARRFLLRDIDTSSIGHVLFLRCIEDIAIPLLTTLNKIKIN